MTNMRVMTMAQIRNARGLDSAEKSILYTIESRGEVFSKVEVFRADCGLGKNKFYRTLTGLKDKGLVNVTDRRPRGTTVYTVSDKAVASLVPNVAPGGDIESMSPPVEMLQRRESNVAPVGTPRSPPLGHLMSPPVGTQREPLKGSPQGDPKRQPTPIGGTYFIEYDKDGLNAWDSAAIAAQEDRAPEALGLSR